MKRRRSMPALEAFVAAGPPSKRYRSDTATRAIVRSEIKKNSDLKYTDSTIANTAVSASGLIGTALANLIRGDAGINAFDGNTITPQGLTVKYMWYSNQIHNQVRLLCFQWLDSSTPSASSVLQSVVTGLGTLSATNVNSKDVMRVLYDKTHVIAPTAGGDTTVIGNGTSYEKFFISGKRLRKIRYNITSNTVVEGNIYFLAISDDVLATFPAINLYSRLSFYD